MAHPLPAPVTLHPDLQRSFGCPSEPVYTARVVRKVTSRGRHHRRVFLITSDCGYLCETSGVVRRVLPFSQVSEALVTADGHVLVQMLRPEEEPSVLYTEEDDERNSGMPCVLDTLAACWAHVTGSELPVHRACAGTDVLSLGRFEKGGRYQTPLRRLLAARPELTGIVSPSVSNSDVSERCDSPRKSVCPLPTPRASGDDAALASEVRTLRELLRLQADALESVRRHNEDLEGMHREARRRAEEVEEEQRRQQRVLAGLREENGELRRVTDDLRRRVCGDAPAERRADDGLAVTRAAVAAAESQLVQALARLAPAAGGGQRLSELMSELDAGAQRSEQLLQMVVKRAETPPHRCRRRRPSPAPVFQPELRGRCARLAAIERSLSPPRSQAKGGLRLLPQCPSE
eukprot:TRINITY_DN17230_c0_g1_i1.p1 TRINITY_DN17230_c0_g1~~TRINITY_DN17230_c0_g1_i1.p1  ORF type:complete len:404 (+),score=167.93 TRINITY_DN17230_c0_g1_i1:74-1285(+)